MPDFTEAISFAQAHEVPWPRDPQADPARMGDADRDYLRRLASTEQGSIFAHAGELVQTFGHIARVISEGGRSLRKIP